MGELSNSRTKKSSECFRFCHNRAIWGNWLGQCTDLPPAFEGWFGYGLSSPYAGEDFLTDYSKAEEAARTRGGDYRNLLKLKGNWEKMYFYSDWRFMTFGKYKKIDLLGILALFSLPTLALQITDGLVLTRHALSFLPFQYHLKCVRTRATCSFYSLLFKRTKDRQIPYFGRSSACPRSKSMCAW